MQEKTLNQDIKICVVGLGYVGLPLAIEFSKQFPVIGFDISERKIADLKKGNDSMNEISSEALVNSKIFFTTDPNYIKLSNFIIIAVPTPVTENKAPDLSYVHSASEKVGLHLSKGSVVVYESTVYPGVTDEECCPILEQCSGLKAGRDFKIAYSPERVNPGDKEHTIDKITKIVSGMDAETLDLVAYVYGKIITAGVYRASSIKVAEAAKVIENIQRDLNIALMNELALIFHRMGISTKEVIDAASTKWNFHKYFPGLVGGHCIGVDPYYLTYKAQELGYNPEVILSGRNVNNYMPKHIADIVIKSLIMAGKRVKECRVLLMGLTFKEDVKDARNSRAKDLITELRSYSVDVIAHEPHLDESEAYAEFDVKNYPFNKLSGFDCIILVNRHKAFSSITVTDLLRISTPTPILIDVKNMFNKAECEEKGIIYHSL